MRGGEVRNFYYLVKGYREGGKVKQKTVFRLGEYPTFDAYLKAVETERQEVRNRVERLEYLLKKTKETFKLTTATSQQVWILRKHPRSIRFIKEEKLPKLDRKYQEALAVKEKYVVE